MYQESGDEQSKHLWAQRDFPDLPLTDGAGLETASPAKVRLAAVLDGGATAQPSAPGTSCQAKLTPWPTNRARQWPAGGKQKHRSFAVKLTCSGFLQVCRQIVSSLLCAESQSSLLCLRWILKSVRVQCTFPAPEIPPAPSQMFLWKPTATRALISPTSKAKASAEQSEPRETPGFLAPTAVTEKLCRPPSD